MGLLMTRVRVRGWAVTFSPPCPPSGRTTVFLGLRIGTLLTLTEFARGFSPPSTGTSASPVTCGAAALNRPLEYTFLCFHSSRSHESIFTRMNLFHPGHWPLGTRYIIIKDQYDIVFSNGGVFLLPFTSHGQHVQIFSLPGKDTFRQFFY